MNYNYKNIEEKLNSFIENKKIPHIIFNGPYGCGKKTIVNNFINKIYDKDQEVIKKNVMYVNCSHGKGIKFIREDLKFFAKTHINSQNGLAFKSIILVNADQLTIDAQSALRRCIEIFSHNTRFFIIIEDKYNLLTPILSRFCEIYIPPLIKEGKVTNYYEENINKYYQSEYFIKKNKVLLTKLQTFFRDTTNFEPDKLSVFIDKLYNLGYNSLDIISQLGSNKSLKNRIKNISFSDIQIKYHIIKKQIKNEKLLLFLIFNFILFSSKDDLENMSFM